MECNIEYIGIHDNDYDICPCSEYRYEFDGSVKSAINTILSKWEDIADGKYDMYGSEYNYLGEFYEGLAAVRRNGLIGYIDISGEYAILPKFTWAYEFHNGIAAVSIGRKRNAGYVICEKWGVIDKSGNWIISPIYNSINYFGNKLACRNSLNILEFRTYDGELCFRRNFTQITYYSNGAAAVLTDDKWGFIDKKGNYILEPIYDDFHRCSQQNQFVVKKDYYWGIIDNNHKILLPFIYERVCNYENGYIGIRHNYKCGFLSASFEEIIPCIYDGICYNSGDIIGIMIKRSAKHELWGWCDMRGNVIVEPQYSDIKLCQELIMICNNGKYGFVNHRNEVVIPCKYRYIGEFVNGFAIVKHRHKYGFINKSGEMVIAAKYSELYPFCEGYAAVTRNGESYYINEKGERAIL